MTYRTPYDRQMIEMFTPSTDSYHSPPWPGSRTAQDRKQQMHWCPPPCSKLPHMVYHKPAGRWCPSCPKDGSHQ